jgi:gas vesicle protein
MNKSINFFVGVIAGALVGAAVALLVAPSSGAQLRADMVNRWEEALMEARQAMEETRRDLQAQFEQMQRTSPSQE